MESTHRTEGAKAQSREDKLIKRLSAVHEALQGLQMAMTRTAVMQMAETYLAIEDAVQYIAERRDGAPGAETEEDPEEDPDAEEQ